jgi:serine/threonine protein kinase
LKTYLAARQQQDIQEVKGIMIQILQAMKYLHHKKLIHSNLRLSNIEISDIYKRIKLVDLGVLQPSDMGLRAQGPFISKMRYISPEEFDGKISFKSDVWAFGCILFELITGLEPFSGIEEEAELCNILLMKRRSPLEYALEHKIFACRSIFKYPSIMSLLKGCFQLDYNARPSFSQISKMPFFT